MPSRPEEQRRQRARWLSGDTQFGKTPYDCVHVRAISPTDSISGRIVRPARASVVGLRPFGTRRDHAAVAVRVQRVDVAAVVEDRRDRLRMDAADVVDLGVRLHRDLPVALQAERMCAPRGGIGRSGTPATRPRWVRATRAASARGIEIHEDQLAEAFAADALQAATTEVEVAEILAVAHREQFAVVAVRPAVITADEARALARRFRDDRRAAVAARVVERVDRAAVGVNDQDRLSRHSPTNGNNPVPALRRCGPRAATTCARCVRAPARKNADPCSGRPADPADRESRPAARCALASYSIRRAASRPLRVSSRLTSARGQRGLTLLAIP